MKSPDLAGIQPEFRHVRMSRHDAFAKRFFELARANARLAIALG